MPKRADDNSRNAIVLTCFLLGLGVCAWLLRRSPEPLADIPTASTVATPNAKPQGPTAEEIAGPHLAWAALETAGRIDAELAPIEDFFHAVKARTPEFAKQALSWSGKWRLMADYVPGTRGDRHETFLREKFESQLFSSKQLELLLESAVKNYRLQIDGVENEMFVRIRGGCATFRKASTRRDSTRKRCAPNTKRRSRG
ncbi:MAG: hypothetical protein QM811_16985 [Pirellulales bacterium]